MRPIDRYLKELRAHLPGDQADDIVEELEANLQERLDDREAELGRALTEAEEEAIVREHGDPLAAAASYRPEQLTLAFGRQLIGPALFPAYMRVLALNIGATVVVVAVATIVLVANGQPFGTAIPGIALAILIQFGIVTAIFTAADRTLAGEHDRATAEVLRELVKPRPTVLDRIAEMLIGPDQPVTVSRRTSVSDLTLAVIGVGWLVVIRPPVVIGSLHSGPGWEPFHYAAIGILVLSAIPPLVNLARPALTRFRSVGRILADLAFVALFAGSALTGHWVELVDGGASAELRPAIDEINRWIGVSVGVALGITALMTLFELRRLVVRRPGAVASGTTLAAR